MCCASAALPPLPQIENFVSVCECVADRAAGLLRCREAKSQVTSGRFLNVPEESWSEVNLSRALEITTSATLLVICGALT